MGRLLVVMIVIGCGQGSFNKIIPLQDSDLGEPSYGERCGDNVDNDGDGLVDEDCAPSLFTGVYAPMVAADPALAELEAAAGHPLAVVQTYHATNLVGLANLAPDLAAIFTRGQVANLNLEPAGYSPAQYASPNDPSISDDLSRAATILASALKAAPQGRVILTFAAEMNGNWTDWGCLPRSQYIALYRAAHIAVDHALAMAFVEPRRVRWAYGPSSTSSTNCGSAADYFPGVGYVDLLGMSAYRSGTASVDEAVLAPMNALFDALAYPPEWSHDRFVLLQTGSRDIAGDDRGAWIASLYTALAADDRVAGVIYFDASDWAASATVLGPALATAPIADRGLDAVFAPRFLDVPYNDPAFGEIQAIGDTGFPTGCPMSPPRFCPDDPVYRLDAMVMMARTFRTEPPFRDPVLETDIENAIIQLHGERMDVTPGIVATRARAAVIISHGARTGIHPF